MTKSNLGVIAPFIDSDTGKLLNPGDPLPNFSRKREERLIRARCIGPLPTGRTVATPAPEATFPADSQAVAGGDGGDSGGRSKPRGKRGKKAQ